VGGRLRHRLAVAALDHPAGVHHQGLVGEVAGRGDVVGDVEDRQVEAFLEVAQQVQHAEADRDVQHGHRLVGQQGLGLGAERAGDRDTLTLAAGELVRELVEVTLGRGKADPAEQLVQRVLEVLIGPARVVVNLQRAGEVVADRVHRIQRRERVLEDHLDSGRVRPERTAALDRGGLAVQADVPVRTGVELGEQAGDRALARARLADERDHLAAPEGELHVVDGVHGGALLGEQLAQAAAYGKVLGQADRLEHHLAGGRLRVLGHG
jgi:hypothetical protein